MVFLGSPPHWACYERLRGTQSQIVMLHFPWQYVPAGACHGQLPSRRCGFELRVSQGCSLPADSQCWLMRWCRPPWLLCPEVRDRLLLG